MMTTEILIKVAEIKLVYKTNINPSERSKISDSNCAFRIFMQVWDKDKIEYTEAFKVMYLNRANKVLGVHDISEGGINGTVMDIRIILQGALKTNASGIIVAHNHPSGNLEPSETDRQITNKLKNACNFMDIALLDHLILTPGERYISFADENWI